MKTIDEMIDDLLKREGGYVNDKDDPGGATKYGITIHTLSDVRGRKVTAQDVRNLTLAEAKRIYKDRYFHKPKIDQLPEALQPSVFDMYVNAGSNAFKILQRTINLASQSFISKNGSKPFGELLAVDGALGPKTIEAVNKAYDLLGRYLVDAYGIERRNYYFRLADKRPASRKYARTRAGNKGGWIKRAEEFMSPRYHMSQSQFKERTKAWG